MCVCACDMHVCVPSDMLPISGEMSCPGSSETPFVLSSHLSEYTPFIVPLLSTCHYCECVCTCMHLCVCVSVCVCVRVLSLTHASYGASAKMFTSITLCPKHHSMSQILVWQGFLMHIVNYHSFIMPAMFSSQAEASGILTHSLMIIIITFSETLYPSITWHTALWKHLHLINQIHTLLYDR